LNSEHERVTVEKGVRLQATAALTKGQYACAL
jgi:hypothetical protein